MRAYLDQKDWIELARLFHGVDSTTQDRERLRLIAEAVDSGPLRLPLSRVHLLEAAKIGDSDRRARLVQAFVRFSKGWVLRPAELIAAEEVARWARGEAPPAPTVLSRGLLAAFGDNETLAATLGVAPEEVASLNQFSDHPAAWLEALSAPALGDAATQVHAAGKHHVETVDSVRAEWARLAKSERLDIYARGVLGDLKVALDRAPEGVSAGLVRLESLSTEDLMEAVAQIPSLHVMTKLGEAKARDLNRPTEANDLWDLSFLSVAIPYLGLVVTERSWAHHAKALGLDNCYRCRVVANLGGLVQELS